MSVEMKVTALAIEPANNRPVVILTGTSKDSELLVAIGLVEASAIAIEIEHLRLPRPLTHDLLCSVIQSLGGELTAVEVNDLKEGTYHACLLLQRGDEEIRVDSRTSDAIAIALRMRCPILVTEDVLEKSRVQETAQGTHEDIEIMLEEAQLVEFLENLPREDFGEYLM